MSRFELDRYRILRTVDAVVLSSEVGVQKPDPAIFRIALDRIGIPPGATVFVGNDRIADVVGARSVGLRAIYVNDRAIEGVRMASAASDVIEVAPTFEAISSALRTFG